MGPLSVARFEVGATGSSSGGYFAGGSASGPAAYGSVVDRVDYSNDTATAAGKGPLARAVARASGSF